MQHHKSSLTYLQICRFGFEFSQMKYEKYLPQTILKIGSKVPIEHTVHKVSNRRTLLSFQNTYY